MHAKHRSFSKAVRHFFVDYFWLHLMVLPGLAFFILFKYVPMYGIIIAFKNYKGAGGGYAGIASAPWIGLKNFQTFFSSLYAGRVFGNTIYISLLRLVFSFPAPILLALLINEIRKNWFKRTVQTITYMPYFLSWVVVAGLLNTLLSPDMGAINVLIKSLGGTPVYFLTSKNWFRPILVISEIWKSIGYGSIVYLAAITGIDQEQYEAARIDGANRFQQCLHITIPGIMPTIIILFILRMGNILNVGYEKTLLLYNSNIYDVSDIISTYTYRLSFSGGTPQYSYSTAIGLFNTLVNVVFLLGTNYISGKFSDSSLF